jgi:regulatory protein
VRIRRDLAGLGLPPTLIETQLESHGDWAALARKVLTRRFGARPPHGWPDKARRMRFLQYRGFGSEDIRFALGGADIETDIDAHMETDLDT